MFPMRVFFSVLELKSSSILNLIAFRSKFDCIIREASYWIKTIYLLNGFTTSAASWFQFGCHWHFVELINCIIWEMVFYLGKRLASLSPCSFFRYNSFLCVTENSSPKSIPYDDSALLIAFLQVESLIALFDFSFFFLFFPCWPIWIQCLAITFFYCLDVWWKKSMGVCEWEVSVSCM